MFGFNAFAASAFNSLLNVISSPTPTPPTWGKTGGIGKKHELKKSKRAEIQDAVRLVIDGPEIEEEMIVALQPYVKAQQSFSPFSIDYKRLANDMAVVQRLLFIANEMRQEQEDEELLLMML